MYVCGGLQHYVCCVFSEQKQALTFSTPKTFQTQFYPGSRSVHCELLVLMLLAKRYENVTLSVYKKLLGHPLLWIFTFYDMVSGH